MGQKKRTRSPLRALHDVFLPHERNGRHPHLFRTKTLLGVCAIIVVLELGVVSQLAFFSHAPGMTASVLPAVITELTNRERAQNSDDALALSSVLSRAAQAKADDMAAKGYFAHQSPDGTLPWHWLDAAGYNYQFAGENLAVDFSDSADVVNAWMNSPAHRENILKQEYTQIGIGIAEGFYQGHETTFIVQFFGTPESAAASVPLRAPAATATKPARFAPTTPVETAAPASAAKVLGSQSDTSATPSWWMNLIASPQTSLTYVLIGLGFFFLLFLAFGLLPLMRHRSHPLALANGIGIVVAVLVLVVLNGSWLPSADVAVGDSQNASAALALPH